MDVSPLKRLIEGALGDPSPVIFFWQIGVAAVALVLGYFTARIVCREVKPSTRWKFGAGDFERVAYPALAWVYLFLGKLILRLFQRVPILEILQSLLVAWVIIRVAVYVLGHVLPHGSFLKRAVRTVAWIAWIGVALHLTGLLPEVIAALDDVGFSLGKDKDRITVWIVLQGLAALALTLALAAWISRITESRVMASDMEMSTRIVLSKVVHATTLLLAILIVLPMVGIPLTALSIFSGALGVGLGFGLQKIASNYVSGFIVLLDKSLRIGDVVTVDNRKGEVRAIESRYTVIRGGDGVESIIPNEKLITESVNHHTYSDPKVSLNLNVVAGFDVDVDAMCELLLAAARSQSKVLVEPLAVARVKGLRDHGIEFELTVWMEMGAVQEPDLRSDVYKEILAKMRQAGIANPYPRREVLTVTPETHFSPKESVT